MHPAKEEIKDWLKKFRHSREWLGQQCGNISKKTVDNWLSSPQKIPHGTLNLIARLMADDEREEDARLKAGDPELSFVALRSTADELNEWARAYKESDAETLDDWTIQAIRSAIQSDTLHHAAAGPGIDTHGDSMAREMSL